VSHTPFILASYLISTVVLLWAALAPVVNKRGLLRQLKNRQSHMDKSRG
jgi:heme exporter protein CcmD